VYENTDAFSRLYQHNPHDHQLTIRNPVLLKQFQDWVIQADAKHAMRFAHFIGYENPNKFWYLPDTEKEQIVRQKLTRDVLFKVPDGLWVEFMATRSGVPNSNRYNMGLHMVRPRPLENAWLIHFTDNADAILENGFLGTESPDPHDLYATFGSERSVGGFNFAFLADSFETWVWGADDFYGSTALLFQANGVHTYHSGDEDEEVIFWGPDVDPAKIIRIDNNDGTWVAPNGMEDENLHALVRGLLNIKVVTEAWVGSHGYGTDDPCHIHINPSRQELAKLIKEAKFHELRGLLATNLYVWDAGAFAHHDFPAEYIRPEDYACKLMRGERERQGIFDCVNLHIDATGPFIIRVNIDWADDDETDPGDVFRYQKAFAEQHPIMKRLFGNIRLRIGDE
jgi:hypothetical protein